MSDLVERLREVAERPDANYPAIMEQAADRIEQLEAALREIQELPGELNPSNCDHDDVVALNDAFVKTWQIASAALAAPSAAMEERT